jgi:type III pantothenate kinase
MNERGEPVILAVDIGNSRTHLAAVDVGRMLCTNRIDFDNEKFDGLFAASIKKYALTDSRIRKASITSCIRNLAVRAKKCCEDEGCFDDVVIVEARDDLPISLNYENAQKLGTDRICSALACSALFSNQNCIIISSGTAVTIDYLHGGKKFEGGMILPGISLQLNALHQQTDALPLVKLGNWDDGNSVGIDFPATSTEKCIKTGVLYGIAGAIEKVIGRYGNDEVKIVATGGGWEVIKPAIKVDIPITAIPDLTLIGAALYS